jgi:hypothetical protein
MIEIGLRRAALLLAGIAFCTSGHAAPVERDLGDELVYIRTHNVPEDLPTTMAAKPHAYVIDIRYAHGTGDGATVLAGWLKFHASARSPVFVLTNSETAKPILHALSDRESIAGLVVIGIANGKSAPDLVVKQSASDERRAYEALEEGTSVAALTTDNPDKQRNDEASLARDRAPEADPDSDVTSPDSETLPATKPHGAPIDAALQEAIHVYRGLRALRSL